MKRRVPIKRALMDRSWGTVKGAEAPNGIKGCEDHTAH